MVQTEEKVAGQSEAGCASDGAVVHALEDLLTGAAIAALALDKRFGDRFVLDVARALLDARRQGRLNELLESAHREAKSLPEWSCPECDEINPGTFDVCWNCSTPRPEGSPLMAPESESVLAMEAVVELRTESQGTTSRRAR